MKKYLNSSLGLLAGIISIPLIIVAWPFFCAYFMYNETDEDYL